MDDPQRKPPAPTGVAQLDEQHQRMHQLFQLLETDPGHAGAEERFVELFHALVEHFKCEEDYLEARGYPGLKPHRFEHELLLDQFRDSVARRAAPNPPPLGPVVQELADTIRVHSETVDLLYSDWLRSEVGRG
jgi:hemerythrin-like metal-binding protein